MNNVFPSQKGTILNLCKLYYIKFCKFIILYVKCATEASGTSARLCSYVVSGIHYILPLHDGVSAGL